MCVKNKSQYPDDGSKSPFENYYKRILGKSLSDRLFMNLRIKTAPVLRFRKDNESGLRKLWTETGIEWNPLSWYQYAIKWPANIAAKTPLPGFSERKIFAMNQSSLIPVITLDPKPGEIILDACAACGGKTMFIADEIMNRGVFIANDLSHFRLNRMKQLLKSYGYNRIKVSNEDAKLIYRNKPQYFDKILLDAPCSSEKHVYNNPKYLNQWSEERIKINKQKQIELLNNIFKATKVGGTVVYSTCAITPEENEEVTQATLAYNKRVRLIKPRISTPVSSGISGYKGVSENVIRVWPDKQSDPMFVAVFKKMA